MSARNHRLSYLTSYIGEVTAENLSSKIRLDLRCLGKHDITLISNKHTDLMFGDAVRDGNETRVLEYLKIHSLQILFSKLSIALNLEKNTSLNKQINSEHREDDDADNAKECAESPSSKVVLTITPFHLAIIAGQTSIIKLFMKWLVDSIDMEKDSRFLIDALKTGTIISFPKNPVQYGKNDRSLDGMNAFHLSAKYCVLALKEIFYSLNENGLIDKHDIKVLLEAKDRHLKQTPLHVAAKCNISTATK